LIFVDLGSSRRLQLLKGFNVEEFNKNGINKRRSVLNI